MHHVCAITINVRRAVIAVAHAVIAIAHVVMAIIHARRQGVAVMVAVHVRMVAIIMVITAPNADRVFLIGRVRREIAGTGIGRALIGVVILMQRRVVIAVLHFGIRQPLIVAPAAAAATGVAARINRSHGHTAAPGIETARARRDSAGGHYGDC